MIDTVVRPEVAAPTAAARPISVRARASSECTTESGGSSPHRTAAAGSPDSAVAADLASLAIRAALDRVTGALARAASAFVSQRAWTLFGFARLDDHARERCGRSGRWFRDLAALGDGIAAASRLADALTGADGGRPIGRVAATLVARAVLSRVRAAAPSEVAAHWIAAARCLSVRDLRLTIRQAATPASSPDAHSAAGTDPVADMKSAADTDSVADMEAASDPDADRVLLRVPVPSPIVAAFDEALDLHRAVEGYTSSVTAFVESLVGEARSGGAEPSPGFVRPLEHGPPEARCEAALRRASAAWSALPEPRSAPRPGADLVSRFRSLEAAAGEGDAVALDRQLRALIVIETELEAELGRLLALMTERHDWVRLQFAGVGHYAEERLGMSRSRAGERARLARALRTLPSVADACSSGRISMEAAALIHRILTGAAAESDAALPPGSASEPGAARLRDLEVAWVEHAATVTVKRMRDEARALGRYRARAYSSNALPPDPAAPPRPLTDPGWSASLRREAGTAARRILAFGLSAAGLLPTAGSESADSSPEPDVFYGPTGPEPDVFHRPTGPQPDVFHPTGPEPDVFHSLMPEPDATLRLRLPAELAADFLAAIESARSAVEARVSLVPWDAPWPEDAAGAGASGAEWAARAAFIRGRRVPMWVGLLSLLEDFAATWDTDAAAPERRDDRVFIRDGWRCMAPGCSSRRNLEDHHVVYRSRGGDDDPSNRVTLCRFHHQRGEHGDLMSVRGRAPGALTWRLGRPDVAVTFRNERRSG